MVTKKEYTYPSFTDTFNDLDKLGFLGHGVDLDVSKQNRMKLLGRKVPSRNMYLRKDKYGYMYLTVFTYSASNRVHRYLIKEESYTTIGYFGRGPVKKEKLYKLIGEDEKVVARMVEDFTSVYELALEDCW